MVERLVQKDAGPTPLDAPLELRPRGPELGAEELHELRVRIPVDLHRQLLSLKVLRGKSLAETVSLALDIYFSQVKASIPHSDGDVAEEKAQLT